MKAVHDPDFLRELNKNFASTLKELRVSGSLTQHDLSDRSGLSLRMISDMERGLRQPTLGTLFKLAHGLGISIYDLLRNFSRK
ncbi:MAG: helix-turn-helix transcriptional regulator [Bacteroidetes bacterium]|nr:helix-turn-helix transcriptional regulator [Bacteroidota bacterium]MDA1122296.1 helix-turn-helix transcriptional regulator [Bacteroidota bacterium]